MMISLEEEATLGRQPLPVGLHHWLVARRQDDWTDDRPHGTEQVMFVRDLLIPGALWKVEGHPWLGNYDRNRCLNSCKVIATHRSKSIVLPVYEVDFIPDVKLTFRGNFYDWKLSVNSLYPIKLDHTGVFVPSNYFSTCYCEGIPEESVYGSYKDSQRKFTIEVRSDHQLWFVFRQIANSLMRLDSPLAKLAIQAD